GKDGPVLLPGRSGASVLIEAIRGTHAKLPRMPYKRPPLDSTQIVLLKAWIDAGARSPANEEPSSDRHWAFVALERPSPPKIRNSKSEIRNPIDAFIRARL